MHIYKRTIYICFSEKNVSAILKMLKQNYKDIKSSSLTLFLGTFKRGHYTGTCLHFLQWIMRTHLLVKLISIGLAHNGLPHHDSGVGLAHRLLQLLKHSTAVARGSEGREQLRPTKSCYNIPLQEQSCQLKV